MRLACAIALVAACRPRESAIERDPATKPTASTTTSAPPTTPAIEVRVHRDANQWFDIEVANVGHTSVSLSGTLDVEQLGDGGWSSVLYKDVSLALDCSKATCTTIAPGATLHPGAWWTATNGCIQDPCACEDGGACVVDCLSAPAPAGKYRIVARSCDGKTRSESDAFDVVKR